MADSTAEVKSITPSSSDGKSFDSGADVPPKFSLSSEQLQNCSRVLQAFKDKLKSRDVIFREFKSLQAKRITPSELRSMCSVALDAVNKSKNRYMDIVPFDTTRVVLNSPSDLRPSVKGYINASFVQASFVENSVQFIAAQGPLPHTCQDFWEMVLEYRCPVIVMLTRLVDNHDLLPYIGFKKVKCNDYLPEQDGRRQFGNICIDIKWIKTTQSSLILRQLEVSKLESDEPTLSVLHIYHPEWPDNSVPSNTLSVREIVRRTCHLSGPIVVHCSAGIGRTGTYITIHHTIQRIIAGDTRALDLEKTVSFFRSQRVGLVQTLSQYYFCYVAVIDEMEALLSDYNHEVSSFPDQQ